LLEHVHLVLILKSHFSNKIPVDSNEITCFKLVLENDFAQWVMFCSWHSSTIA